MKTNQSHRRRLEASKLLQEIVRRSGSFTHGLVVALYITVVIGLECSREVIDPNYNFRVVSNLRTISAEELILAEFAKTLVMWFPLVSLVTWMAFATVHLIADYIYRRVAPGA